jgi:hypothetical protein
VLPQDDSAIGAQASSLGYGGARQGRASPMEAVRPLPYTIMGSADRDQIGARTFGGLVMNAVHTDAR